MVILVNNLFVEVYQKPVGTQGYWKSKAIRIYDPLETVSEEQERLVVQYLYDEGFIEDRRTDLEVVKGKDCDG